MKLGISDRGLRRLAQDQTKVDLLQRIENGDLAGWYVHAANKPLLERNTGYITLFVEGDKWLDVSHYGDFFNFVNPTISVYIGDIEDEILEALKEDYEEGKLSPDLESWLESSGEEIDWDESVRDPLNPNDIIDTAGWWDNPDFTSWFNERFDYNFITTYDGAVLFSAEEFEGDLVVVTQEELDELWNI